MGERSLAQVAHEAYWEATIGVATPWDVLAELHKDAWEAAARAVTEAIGADNTIDDLRAVNAVLRTQLAQATDEAATLRLQLADVSERLRTVERQTREAQRRVEWVADDGRRLLVRWRLEREEVAEVGPSGVDPCSVSYAYAEGRVSGTGHHTDPTRDPEQAMQAAQRIVETLTGVRP